MEFWDCRSKEVPDAPLFQGYTEVSKQVETLAPFEHVPTNTCPLVVDGQEACELVIVGSQELYRLTNRPKTSSFEACRNSRWTRLRRACQVVATKFRNELISPSCVWNCVQRGAHTVRVNRNLATRADILSYTTPVITYLVTELVQEEITDLK